MPNEISLREYIEKLIDERHALYLSKFDAAKEAIQKAEETNKEYRANANEWRGVVTDQRQTLAPRAEMQSLEIRVAALERQQSSGEGGNSRAAALRALLLALAGLGLGILGMWLAQRG